MNSPTTNRMAFKQIAELWAELPEEERVRYFRSMDNIQAQELFIMLDAGQRASLLCAMDPPEQRLWMRSLDPDDAADLIQELPGPQRDKLSDLLDPNSRIHVNALLAYAEDVAGGLMSPRYARMRPDMRVAEALRYVHKQALEKVETVYYVYVLGPEQELLGMLSFRQLFTAPPGEIIRHIMKTDLITARETMDQEELGRLFAQYDLLAIPVLDETNHMKGIVTIDDIVDVVEEEATEDIQKLGGSDALDSPYFQIGLLEMIKKRAGWLVILFAGELLTASAMGYYQDEIARAVVLALFLPLIISSGGNAGSQASTIVIRAMALGQVRLKDWLRIARREIVVGLSLGIILSGVGLLRVLLWQHLFHAYGPHYLLIGITVFLSIIGVVLWGTISGALLPMILQKAGVDPATASTPFVATMVDVTGLLIYFNIALVVLHGTLLR